MNQAFSSLSWLSPVGTIPSVCCSGGYGFYPGYATFIY
jgi:hypothetical protein